MDKLPPHDCSVEIDRRVYWEKLKMFISISDNISTTLYLNETSEYWTPKPRNNNNIKHDISNPFFVCFWRPFVKVKKSLQTESIPLLLSQAERQFDGDDSDCFLSSDDMTPFKKHNIYYKSRWARVSSLLFCGQVSPLNSVVYLSKLSLPPNPPPSPPISWWFFAVIGVGVFLQCI